MSGFIVGLIVGLAAAGILVLVFVYARLRGAFTFASGRERLGYRKVIVATIDRPFSKDAIALASGMAGRKGILETFYVVEIPLDRPFDTGGEQELASGMDALEKAERIARRYGVRPIPRMEKARLGSKKVVEVQKGEDFDAVVLYLQESAKSERDDRKIIEYVQANATCPVVVITGR